LIEISTGLSPERNSTKQKFHLNQMEFFLIHILSTINHQPSTINHQPSTINHQPSTINLLNHSGLFS